MIEKESEDRSQKSEYNIIHIKQESWQIQAIEEAMRIANSLESQWVEGEDVESWLDSWGTENDSF